MALAGPITLHADHELAWNLAHPDFTKLIFDHYGEIDANLGASDAAASEGASAFPNGEPLIASYESQLNDAQSKSPAVTQDTTQPIQQTVISTEPIRTSVKAKLSGIDYSTGQYINALNGNVQPPGSVPEQQQNVQPTSNQPSCQGKTAEERQQIQEIAGHAPSECP